MSNVAFLKTDLSRLRLVGEGTDATWTAPELGESDELTARTLRYRATDGAAWLASQPGIRRRLSGVVLDVDDALCAWVKAPSEARPVLSAALRNLMQEWGDEHLADSVEALTHREKERSDVASRSPLMRKLRSMRRDEDQDEATPEEEPLSFRQGVAVSVLALPDALARLWLDALDRRSVKVGPVLSLWHGAALAWNDASDAGVTGVLLIDDDRLVWSWASGHDLLAGGAVELERARPAPDAEDEAVAPREDHRPAACKRLALDWLTWASQLGVTPDRLVLVGPDCKGWASALAAQWTDIPAHLIEEPRAVGATLASIASSGFDASESSRRCLAALSHRPTRALRARYRLAGAAMLLLLVAVSSVAFRLSQKAEEWRDQAAAIREESVDAVRVRFPGIGGARVPNPEKAAEMQVQTLLGAESIEMPPQPREVLIELTRIADIFAAPEAEIRILEIELDQDRGNELRYTVPDRQLAAEILQQLKEGPNRQIDWNRRPRDPDPLTPVLTGDWILK